MAETERATLLLTHGCAARRRRCCEELDAGSRFSAATKAETELEPTTTPNCETDLLFPIKDWSNPGKMTDF